MCIVHPRFLGAATLCLGKSSSALHPIDQRCLKIIAYKRKYRTGLDDVSDINRGR